MFDSGTGWHRVVAIDELPVDRGVAVLIGDRPVALFRLTSQPGQPAVVHAVGHLDPDTGAPVMARGLVGSVGEQSIVSSPLHKQRFDLVTGCCLDDDGLALAVYPTRVDSGDVAVRLPDDDHSEISAPKHARLIAD